MVGDDPRTGCPQSIEAQRRRARGGDDTAQVLGLASVDGRGGSRPGGGIVRKLVIGGHNDGR